MHGQARPSLIHRDRRGRPERGLDEAAVKSGLADLGADNIDPGRRGPNPLADLVKGEAERLIPILEAATGK